MLTQLRLQAFEPEKIAALMHLVEHDLGYRLYRAVEQTRLTSPGGRGVHGRFATPR